VGTLRFAHPTRWESNNVGVTVFVFDEPAASAQIDLRDWIRREIEAGQKQRCDSPQSSSPRLRKWFDDMQRRFPLIGDAHPDDPRGTEYCFFRNVIDVIFAGLVAEEGVFQAWKLAEKHRLRLLVGEDLLPLEAPKAKRDFHVTLLHGRRPDTGIAPNICFGVFDPDIAHVGPGRARTWILTRLSAETWSEDRSVLAGDRLKKWMDRFAARNLGTLVSEMQFTPDLIFIRVDNSNSASMIGPIMELSNELDVPFEVYANLN
jgi:hypothetical protein